MAQVDSPDVGSHVEPDQREPGHGRIQSRVNSAPVVGDLGLDAARTDDRDAAPAGVDVQVNDVVVELGFSEVDPDAAQIGADVCLLAGLPSSRQAQPPEAGVYLQRWRRSSGLRSLTVRNSCACRCLYKRATT
jgi:hypothetical protein